MNRELEKLKKWVRDADAIIVGAGSGLSSAAGYNHYHWRSALEKPLHQLKETYGFESPFAGFYYCYSDYESQWGYYSQYIKAMLDAPTGQPILDLKELIGDKPHFILTTNIDMQLSRVFDEKNLCMFQGDFSLLQCSQPCGDELTPAEELICDMTANLIDGMWIPTELVPRCKHCGRVLVPWVRDDTFLEGLFWKESVQKYYDFANKWIGQKDKNVLLLELGVGEMTPAIIKLPFWNMTLENKNVRYVCMNQEESSAPEHLGEKALYVQGDLAETLHLMTV